MKKAFISQTISQTKKFGQLLAKQILKTKPNKRALVIGLIGELGSGKTTFIQGFAEGLGIKEKMLSPTFVILKRFAIDCLPFANFYHLDCYRIKKPQELLSLGFADIVRNPQNIVVIEWAEKAKKLLPKAALILRFKFINRKTREIKPLPPHKLAVKGVVGER